MECCGVIESLHLHECACGEMADTRLPTTGEVVCWECVYRMEVRQSILRDIRNYLAGKLHVGWIDLFEISAFRIKRRTRRR